MLNIKFMSSYKSVLLLSIILLVYNEYTVYWLSYLKWPSVHDPKNDSIRLLLIADPQLIGENDEPWYQGWLARWDSDRYLRKTFLLANSYIKPNATIFLGDLFDEGLKADDQQFQRYFDRFQHIYQCDQMRQSHGIRQIFISGDNDVGGEYVGDRNDQLTTRFESFFGQTVHAFELNSFVNLIQLDLDRTASFYSKKKRSHIRQIYTDLKQTQRDESDRLTIVLNHMSLLMKRKEELHGLHDDLKPTLVIKGDSHKFYIAKYNFKQQEIVESHTMHEKPADVYEMHLRQHQNEEMYELSIPTCSYRMGVPNMGFGMLTIASNGIAYLSILWLPSRFACLFNYIYFMCSIVLVYILNLIFRKNLLKCVNFIYKKLYWQK